MAHSGTDTDGQMFPHQLRRMDHPLLLQWRGRGHQTVGAAGEQHGEGSARGAAVRAGGDDACHPQASQCGGLRQRVQEADGLA